MSRLLPLLIIAFLLSGLALAQDNAAAPELQAIMERAKAGDAAARAELGRAYEDGKGVPQDDVKAAEWFRKAADQGNAQAQNSLGVMYALGRGVARDKEEAVRWYRKAAKGGLSEGFYNVAISYFNGEGVPGDLQLAYAYMMIAQSKGNPQAAEALQHMGDELHGRVDFSKFRLAGIYEQGDEVPQDFAAAATLYRELAALGPRQGFFVAQAEFRLCQFCVTGRGVPKDFVQAASRCKAAAQQGVYAAYVVLGRMAEKGLGEPADLKHATDWYRKAAAESVPEGFMEMGRLKLQSSSHDDVKEAYFWFQLARLAKLPQADAQLQKAAAQLTEQEIASAAKAAEEWRRGPKADRGKKIKIH